MCFPFYNIVNLNTELILLVVYYPLLELVDGYVEDTLAILPDNVPILSDVALRYERLAYTVYANFDQPLQLRLFEVKIFIVGDVK
jgi:hypothetical protein